MASDKMHIEIEFAKYGPFYMVWTPDGRDPSKTHMSRNEAQAEAHRLSRTNVGKRFYVLEAQEFYEVEWPIRHIDLREPMPKAGFTAAAPPAETPQDPSDQTQHPGSPEP